jgi:hypothetical protein
MSGKAALVGIKLVIEVLDRYHGPDARKLWLLAWAESANDRTRCGWPGRDLLVHRTGRSPSRVSHVADELVAEGVLKRDGGGNRGGRARFILLPLAEPEKGAESAHPKGGVEGALWAHSSGASKGAPRAHPKPEVKGAESLEKGAESGTKGADPSPGPAETVPPPVTIPSEEQPSKDAATSETPAKPTAQTILASFIDWVRENGGELTDRMRGRLAGQLGRLVAEGRDDRHIRKGLADWFVASKNVALLDDFVNDAMNADARNRLMQNGHGPKKPRDYSRGGAGDPLTNEDYPRGAIL